MPDASGLHQHRGTRAILRMVEFAPATGGLALWVRHENVAAGIDAPPATTDGTTVRYGASFETLDLQEQTGWVAHEVLHVALRHAQRFLDLQSLLGDVDLPLFNICADAIVNSTLGHLGWLRLPAGAVTLDQLLARALGVREDVTTSLLEWDVERLYRAIDDRQARDDGKRQRAGAGGQANAQAPTTRSSGATASPADAEPAGRRVDGPRAIQTRALGGRGHADLIPNDAAREAPEAAAARIREQNERLLRGHVQDGAFSMLRALIADLPRSRTPWEQVLRTRLARGLSRKPALSWSRPTRSYIANQGRGGPGRRLPWEPGFSTAHAAPRLAVIVDVSGSIQNDLMERFAREIEAIARRQESDIVLVIGDDRVRSVAVFKPGKGDLRNITFRGGGGTDFTPLFQGADAHRPDIGVVLTDLDGPAHFRPRWPVIWAVPGSRADADAPFGRKLVLVD
jgi:predicted metal-dependent peptidase